MKPSTIAALRKAIRRGVRRVSPHVAPTQRRALRSIAGDVEIMLELAESSAARVCAHCGHRELKAGHGWCEQWTAVAGAGVELACCKSACSYP